MSAEIITLLAAAFAVGLAGIVTVLGLANVLAGSDDVSERLETYALVPEEIQRRQTSWGRSSVIRWRLRLNSLLSIFVSEALSMRLQSANWPITESEFILIRFWSVVAGLALGWLLFQNILPGIGFAIIAYLIPEFFLRRSIYSRRLKFERQLVDVLVLVKGAVRAGVGFLQALDIVITEMKAPASEEFRRVRREVGLGLPLGQALANLHARMENDDLYLLITAININSQVGGNLSTMLEAVTNTIRERIRLFAEIRALTAMQRYSGYILTLLPFLTAGVLFILNPQYMSKLFEPGIWLCIPIGALILVLLGNIVIRLLSRVEV
jgi:tight adherence protein B